MKLTADQPDPIDLDAAPSWDHSARIRGAVVPLLGPRDVAERTVIRPDIGAPLRSGAVARLWRWLFGEKTPLTPNEDQETEAVRSLCLAFVPPAHHTLVHQLTGGELADLFAIYQGLQQEHLCRVRDWSADQAASHATEAPALYLTPDEPTPRHGEHKADISPIRLVPGGSMPQSMGGQPIGRAAKAPVETNAEIDRES